MEEGAPRVNICFKYLGRHPLIVKRDAFIYHDFIMLTVWTIKTSPPISHLSDNSFHINVIQQAGIKTNGDNAIHYKVS